MPRRQDVEAADQWGRRSRGERGRRGPRWRTRDLGEETRIDITSGSYGLGPAYASLLIRTYKDGVGARLAHDLVLSPSRWSGRLDVSVSEPGASGVAIEVDPSSIEIVSATGGVGPLTGADRRTIRRNIDTKVLPRGRHPDPSFVTTSVEGALPDLRLVGRLTVLGRGRDLAVAVRVVGAEIVAVARISQRDFGITPFSAMLGAIRLRDEVDLELRMSFAGA